MKKESVRIHHVDPMSVAKPCAVIYGVTGPIAGFVIQLGYLALVTQSSQDPLRQEAGAEIPTVVEYIGSINPVLFVMVIILYALAGFFVGYVGALVYNWVSKITGGVKIRV